MTGKELFRWLGVGHPDRSPDPQYWTRTDPDDPDWCLTVAATMTGTRLLAEVTESRYSPLSPRFGTRAGRFHLTAVQLSAVRAPDGSGPGAGSDDPYAADWLLERVRIGETDLPLSDIDGIRRALTQFREAVKTVRDGGLPVITGPEPARPVLGPLPADGGGPERGGLLRRPGDEDEPAPPARRSKTGSRRDRPKPPAPG